MPKISIIVPVYNSGEYILDCLNSLASQTMDDIEVILVDDHGKDDSISKAALFISSYEGNVKFRIEATSSNSGPGAARNRGLDLAIGDYVAFVDSDDYVEPDFCESLYNLAESTGSDLVCCDIVIGDSEKFNADVSDRKHFLRHFVSYFTTFLYDRNLLESNSIRFPVQSIAEDTCFLTCCLLSARRVSQVHKVMYHYRMNLDSVSRKRNPRKAFGRIRSIGRIFSYASSHGYMCRYLPELLLIFLKKGLGMAAKDLIFG